MNPSPQTYKRVKPVGGLNMRHTGSTSTLELLGTESIGHLQDDCDETDR